MIADRAARGIFLLGFMGSGKSTVGRELARLLGVPFVFLGAFLKDYLVRGHAEILLRKSIAPLLRDRTVPPAA